MAVGSLLGIVVPAGIGWDFANFYDAGRRVAAGQAHDLYDPATAIGGASPQGSMRFWGTPLSAAFYVPLSWFPAGTALVLFKIQNVLAFAVAFAVLFAFHRRFASDRAIGQLRFAAVFAWLCLIYQPFWTVFRVGGQTTPTVFLLLAIGLVFHTRGQDWASAVCIVVAALIKPALAPAVLSLLCLSGRSFFVKTAVAMLVAGAISLAFFGWRTHVAFLDLMRGGVQSTFPWNYNSSLYVLVETIRTALGSRAGSGASAMMLSALMLLLKGLVLVTIGVLIVRSRVLHWTVAARRHFAIVVSILFFLWWSLTLWEHYLALLFIPLIYIVASSSHFSRGAHVLVGAIFALSVGQNLIVSDWVGRHVPVEWTGVLLLIALLKAGPLLLMLVFIWRHQQELFRSYESLAWGRVPVLPVERGVR